MFKLVPKLHFNLKKLKTATFLAKSLFTPLYTPLLDPFTPPGAANVGGPPVVDAAKIAEGVVVTGEDKPDCRIIRK